MSTPNGSDALRGLPPPPRAFAFDLDETLVDVERQHVRATRAMLLALGVDPRAARDLFHDTTGASTRAIVELYRAHLAITTGLDEILALRHSAFVAALDEEPAVPMRGAAALLAACRERGPVALVTNGHREDALASIRSAGLDAFFDAIVTAEDVAEPKPAPEPYLVAASRLGAKPAEMLAFEDSARGVASALAAGLRVVATPNERSTPREAVARAHVTLASLDEALPLDALFARLQ